MHASSRRLAALLSLVLVATVGAPAAQASSAQPRGLLDGLGGVIGGVTSGLTGLLNNLLGTAQLAPLTQLTSTLTPGTTPSAQTLSPLLPLVQGLTTSASSPANIQPQAASVLTILSSGSSTPLSTDQLNQVTGLLGTLALTQGLSADQVSVLNGLVGALQSTVGSPTGGLPIIGGILPGAGDLPVGTGLVTSLTDLAGLLSAGTVPTGASLAPVTALLREVAAGVPEPLKSTILQLADAIDQTPGPLGADLLGTLATVLGQIAGTPGVSPGAAAQLGSLSTSLKKASTSLGAPAAKPKTIYASVKTGKARVDRKKGRIVVSLTCQSLVYKCAAIMAPLRGKSSAGKAVLVMIPSGGSATRSLALSKAARRIMKRQTVRFSVVSINQRGATSRKSVTARVPKRHAA